MVKRKARALTRSTNQTGKTNLRIDRKRKALAPGKRRAKSGNTYYESRRNRSDVKGVDTPLTRKQGRKLVRKSPSKPHVMTIGKMKIVITAEKKRRLLAEYHKNEARNYHRENATMLIRVFGTPAQKKRAIAIGKSHDKNRSLSESESRWLSKNGHVHYKKLLPLKKANKSKLVVRKSVTIGARRLPSGKAVLKMTSKTREPLRGIRRHDLLPNSVRSKLPKLYSQDGKKDPMVIVKFFSPYTNYTLYVTEFDGKDTLYGYGGIGGKEWGYASFKEIVTLNRNGLPLVERDMHYGPKRFSKVRK